MLHFIAILWTPQQTINQKLVRSAKKKEGNVEFTKKCSLFKRRGILLLSSHKTPLEKLLSLFSLNGPILHLILVTF